MVVRQCLGIVNGKNNSFKEYFSFVFNKFDRIKITNVHKNEVYEFLVEKILDEDFEEGSSNLILYSEKKDQINEGELPTPRTIIS
jgi:hypothetical protein